MELDLPKQVIGKTLYYEAFLENGLLFYEVIPFLNS